MRTRTVFAALTLSLSLFASACAEDLSPGLEGEDDIDSQIEGGEALKADGLATTATYYNIKRDTRKCASPMCGGYFVNRVNRTWTKCHDGAWRNACYVAAADFAQPLGLSGEEENTLSDDIHSNRVVVRGDVRADSFNGVRLGRFVPSEAWRASTANAPTGTWFRVTDTGKVCITTPCPTLHEAMLNSTTSREIHGLGLESFGADELLVNQIWTDLDKAPLLVVGKNVTYKDPLTGRPGVRLEATQVFRKYTHSDLQSYAPTAREIGGRDFVNAEGLAPTYPRTYRFAYSTWDVVIEDAVAPCPAGAVCIWSGIVSQKATWGVSGDKISLTFPGDTTNAHNIVYYKELSVKHDAAGNLVLVESRGDGTNITRQFR